MISAENASHNLKIAGQNQINQEIDEEIKEEEKLERKDGDCEYEKEMSKMFNLGEDGKIIQMR